MTQRKSYAMPLFIGVAFIAIITAAALLSRPAEQRTPSIDPNPILAKVGDRVIRQDDFMRWLELRLGKTIDRSIPHGSLAVFLDEMVSFESQVEYALQSNIDSDADVQRKYQHLLVGKLRETQFHPDIEALEVSEQEIRDEYQRNKQQYKLPLVKKIAVIELEVPDGANAASRKIVFETAQEVHKLAKNLGPDVRGFGPLAANYSSHQQTRYQGGDLGWVSFSKALPTVLQPVASAARELSIDAPMPPPIETPNAVYLLMLEKVKDTQFAEIGQHEQKIKAKLLRQKRQSSEAAWLKSLRGKLNVEVDYSHLDGLPAALVNRPSVSTRSILPSLRN